MKGLSLAVTASFLFATMPIVARFLYVREVTDPVLMMGLRYTVGAVLFWVSGIGKEVSFPVKREWGWLALTVGGLFLSSFGYFTALTIIPVAVAVLLSNTYPVFTAVIARFLYQEKLGIKKIMALIIVLGGMVILVSNTETSIKHLPVFGIILSLGSSLGYAVFSIGCQSLTGNRDSWWVNRWIVTGIAVVYLFLRPPWIYQLSPGLLLGGLYLGLVATFLGYILYLGAISRVGATRATLCANTEVIFAVILSWLVLGESMGGIQIFGGLLILTGITLWNAGGNESKSKKHERTSKEI